MLNRENSSLQRGERTRLQEVADQAGVSVSTVSLVLAGKAERRRISSDTVARVRRAAEELNYAPNLLTRSLRGGRTRIISFYSTFRQREWGDMYMDRISSAVETAGGDLGYDVLVHCNFRRTLKETYQFLNGGIADGLLLFAPETEDPLLHLLRQSSLPVVLLGQTDPIGQYSSVIDDVEQGMAMVAEEILSHGHTQVAALGSHSSDARDSRQRISLLRASLKTRGVALQEVHIANKYSDVIPALNRLFATDRPPTALFCWHDWIAYRVLQACDELGVVVPDRLSVVGYDGIHWPSTSKHICSSVAVDLRAVAGAGVRLLNEVINDPGTLVEQALIPVSFEQGTTLARLPDIAG